MKNEEIDKRCDSCLKNNIEDNLSYLTSINITHNNGKVTFYGYIYKCCFHNRPPHVLEMCVLPNIGNIYYSIENDNLVKMDSEIDKKTNTIILTKRENNASQKKE